MEGHSARSSAALWGLTVAVAAGGIALPAALAHHGVNRAPLVDVPWLVLVAAFAFSDAVSFDIQFRGETNSITVSEIVFVLGLFCASPAALVVAYVLGSLVAQALVFRLPVRKAAFNLAQVALAS